MEEINIASNCEISRKEEKFMSMINSFLQKRKMHESQHGIIMVITAYALSVLMLIMGSDVFYNIKSAAAGISVDTDEEIQEIQEIQEILTEKTKASLTVNLSSQLLQTKLINPYGIALTTETASKEDASPSETISEVLNEDTVWLLGNAMSSKEFDTAIEQMNSITSKVSSSQTAKDETVASLSKERAVSSSLLSITEEEVNMLERIVEAEATGEDMVGKMLIANVIFNRISDDEFPDTIKEVIFQKVNGDYQFSPVSDERYWSVKVTDETKEAVQRVLQGEDSSEGALFFIARKRTNASSAKWFDQHLDWLFKHGGHEFYKNK